MTSFLQEMNFGILLLLGALSLFWSGALGIGRMATACLSRRTVPPDNTGLLGDLVLGMNLLALLTLAAGSFGLLNRYVILAGLAGLTIAGLGMPGTGLSARSRLLASLFKRHWPLATATAIFGLFTLGSALCYPYAWDEQTYHVAVPYRWVAFGGGLPVFLDSPYSGFPAMPQILFRVGIEIGGIFFPRLLVWSVYLLLLIIIYLILEQHSAKWISLLVAVLVVGSSLFVSMMRQTYVEPFIALNLAAAWLTTYRRDCEDQKLPVWLGVFAGGAAAVKLTGLAAAVLIFLPFVAKAISRGVRRSFREMIISGLVAMAVALPFYLRPWCYAGNPFFPFMAGWFGGDAAALAVSDYHHAMGSAHFGIHSVAGFVAGPVLTAFHGRWFDGIVMGWQFPVLLALTIFLLVRSLRNGAWIETWWIPAGFVFYYCFWFFSAPQTRFMMPLYLIVAVGGAKGLAMLNKPARQAMVILLLVASLISVDWREMRHFTLSWQHVFFPRPPEFFLGHASRDHGYFESLAALEEHTCRESRVMLIFERRGLYVPRDYVIGTPFFQGKYFTPLPTDDRAIFNALSRDGIGYLLLGSGMQNPDHLAEYNDDNLRFARQLVRLIGRKELSLVWSNDYYHLFRVNLPGSD